MKRNHFGRDEHGIRPLTTIVSRRVRFEECDQLGIVWHGRYASFFEDARSSLGEKYGIGYMDFYRNRIVAPIKQIHVDYDRPLRFGQQFTIEATLHWSDAVRINLSYEIRDDGGVISTTGYTVQVMLDLDYNLLLVPPPFFDNFRRKWRSGELE